MPPKTVPPDRMEGKERGSDFARVKGTQERIFEQPKPKLFPLHRVIDREPGQDDDGHRIARHPVCYGCGCILEQDCAIGEREIANDPAFLRGNIGARNVLALILKRILTQIEV